MTIIKLILELLLILVGDEPKTIKIIMLLILIIELIQTLRDVY